MARALRQDATVLTMDLLATGLTAFLLINTLVCRQSVEDWRAWSFKLAAALIWYPAGSLLARTISHRFGSVVAHTIVVVALFDLLFSAMGPMQLIWLPQWMDAQVIALEESMFGVEPSIWFQGITYPVLTEWMSFAYVIYVPLVLLVGLMVYAGGKERATRDYLLRFTWVNVLCYVGFLLYPIASPVYYYPPDTYGVSLDGWMFTWTGEWIRANAHFPGGSLPSPHCAAGTVQLLILFRYLRAWFWWLLPLYVTLYVSTVYLRYHYVTDVVTGIITGAVAWKTAPMLVTQASKLFKIAR